MIWNAFILAIREVRRDLPSSLLAMLGIILGVSAIICLLTPGPDCERVVVEPAALVPLRPDLNLGPPGNLSPFDARQIAGTLVNPIPRSTLRLAAVAGASLLMGGIGIMNIMRASVAKRTREIGIRLSIGATRRDVLLQFLVEAVTISCLGGLAGVGLAVGAGWALARMIEVPFEMSLSIHLLAFWMAAGVGIAFGYAPAQQAASLDPVAAIRHE